MVWVEFEWGTDIYRDRQIVSEKLQLLDLPLGIRPEMTPVSSIMGQILVVAFRSKNGDTPQTELRRLVDSEVRPRLRSVSGVAQVVSTGSRPTELQVIVDASRLRGFGLTLPEVADAVKAANVNVIGGILESGVEAPAVHVPGRVSGAEDLSTAVIRDDPTRPVLLRDVAEVRLAPAAVGVGDAGLAGTPGVLAVIAKQPGIDTVTLTEALLEELESVRNVLPPDIEIVTDVFRQADFIDRAIGNVLEAVRDGSILVVLVLFAFLLNLRTTLITLTAIPLSVAIAALFFEAFGLTIDTMTLGGLAVAIGTLGR